MRLTGLQAEEFHPIRPDGTFELRLPELATQLQLFSGTRLDILYELERSDRPDLQSKHDKLRNYDGFLCGWATTIAPYKALKEPPWGLIICPDQEALERWIAEADRLLTGRLSPYGAALTDAIWVGRERLFFCIERDIHERSLRAFRVPEHPPDARRQLREATAPAPVEIPELLEPPLLR
jgi:hypothetical protein